MPMERRIVDIPLTTGLHQKQDYRGVELSGAITLQNARALKSGAIRKRFGNVALSVAYQNLTTSGSITASVKGGSYKGTGLLWDGSFIYSYSDANAQWEQTDKTPEATILDRLGLGSLSFSVKDYDITYAGGFIWIAMTGDATGLGYAALWVMAIDAVTKAVALPLTVFDQTAACFAPRLLACGTSVVMTYVRSSLIRAAKATAATPSAGFGASSVIVNNAVNNIAAGVYDSCIVTGDATRFATAYEVAGGGAGNIEIQTFAVSNFASLVIKQSDVAANSVTTIGVAATNAELVWVGYAYNTGGGSPTFGVFSWAYTDGGGVIQTLVLVFSYSTTLAFPPVTLGLARQSATQARIIFGYLQNYNVGGGISSFASTIAAQLVDSAGAIALQGPTRATYNILPSSRPMVIGGKFAYVAFTASALQGTYCVMVDDAFGDSTTSNPYPARLAGMFAARLAKVNLFKTNQTTHNFVNATTLGASVYLIPASVNVSATGKSLFVQPVDFASNLVYAGAELGDSLGYAAGNPQTFDGQRSVEDGFPWYPEQILVATSAAGGSMETGNPTDIYQYIIVYEWYDAKSQWHQSATSVAVTADMHGLAAGNAGSVAITIPTLGISARQRVGVTNGPLPIGAAVQIAVYRTTKGGTVFYRAVPSPVPQTLMNVLSAQTVTYTDTYSDAQLTAGSGSPSINNSVPPPLVYTTGGPLDNFAPPGARIKIQHKNRWWLAGTDDPAAIWPSQPWTSGVHPGFNENLNFYASGRVTSLASLDDKLIIFVQRGTQYGIEYITGDGPVNTGTASDWTPPQPVPCDVGAFDHRCTAVGPWGVVFRATVGGPNGTGGIYLLSRDLQVTYIGKAVEDILSANPVVTSCATHPNGGHVYITCSPTDAIGTATAGVRLCWDYLQGGIWSTDTLFDPNATGGVTSTPPRHAWVANANVNGFATPTYHWMDTTGHVFRETDGTTALTATPYYDAGTWVTLLWASAWIKEQLAVMTRFWRLLIQADDLDLSGGSGSSQHNLSIKAFFDYQGSGYSETFAWTDTQIRAFTQFPQEVVQCGIGNQKAMSMQIVIQDAPPSTGNPGITGQSLSISAVTVEMGAKQQTWRNIPSAQRA